MSRLGKKPIDVPGNVKVSIANNNVTIEGPKGKLVQPFRPEVDVIFDSAAKKINVTRKDDSRLAKSLHGLVRALISNMISGVTSGYTKTIEIYGTGYGVQQQGSAVAINVGYANTVKLEVPMGVQVQIQTAQAKSNTQPAVFSISGPDKQVVGEFGARIRRVKKTEPYNGKGIRYQGEHIRRKVGKALAGK